MIDLNCDMGEGFGKDEHIMPFINSCSIACGTHAGNIDTIKATVLLAKKYKVKIGAHPSFPDRRNFGRKEMIVARTDLRDQIIDQMDILDKVVTNEGLLLNHIKAHGALYNMAAKFENEAMALTEALQIFNKNLILYVPYGSLIASMAKEMGIFCFNEVFADRNYKDDLTLVSRNEPEAIIESLDKIIDNIKIMVIDKTIISIGGKIKKINFNTICVHGDNPMAPEIAMNISKILKNR